MSGTALAAGVGEHDRRLAPGRSRDTIFNRNGGEPESPDPVLGQDALSCQTRFHPPYPRVQLQNWRVGLVLKCHRVEGRVEAWSLPGAHRNWLASSINDFTP